MVDPVLPGARPDRQSRGDRLDHHRNRGAAAVTVLSEIDVTAVSDHEPVGTLAHTRSRRQLAAGNPLHVRHARLRNQQSRGAAAARLFHRRPAVPSTGPWHEPQQSRGHHRHGQPGTDARMRFAMEPGRSRQPRRGGAGESAITGDGKPQSHRGSHTRRRDGRSVRRGFRRATLHRCIVRRRRWRWQRLDGW